MGKKDTITNLFYSKPQNFVSVMNLAYHFNLTPDKIEEMNEKFLLYVNRLCGNDENEKAYSKKERFIEKERDVLRKVTFGRQSLLVGIENQTSPDASEPVRVMLYDALTYDRQRKILRIAHGNAHDLKSKEYISGFAKKDRVLPVMTIVIYYGEEEWDFPEKLSDILDIQEHNEEATKISSNIQNYELKIIDVRRLTDEEIETLVPEVKLLFGCVKYSKDHKKMKEFIEKDKENFENLSYETYAMIAEMANVGNVLKTIKKAENGGKYNMCKALDDWLAEEVEKALAEERKKTCKAMDEERENGIKSAIEILKDVGTAWDKALEVLKEKYGMTDETGRMYMNKYWK